MREVENYLLFAGSAYYPRGGARDFMECFDTLEEAEQAVKERYQLARNFSDDGYDWIEIARFDGVKLENVLEFWE